ncbi:hypothetical protein [Streptomyces sp. NPDC048002]|uniref:hypothetical protein n=1 Tax=Streptomyces sp. NPDC048002 TaxID=3154344 RepID=UPI0033C98217
MIDLSWRAATKADKTLLQGFTCTEPARRLRNGRPAPHHREWELEVQTWFRSGDALADANEDAAYGGRLLLGFVEGDLAVCTSHARLRNPGVETPLRKHLGFEGPIRVLKAVGIARVHRGAGGLLADQALDDVLADMLDQESSRETLVLGRVDSRNKPSERFVARNGFELLDDLPAAGQLRNWFMIIEAELDD